MNTDDADKLVLRLLSGPPPGWYIIYALGIYPLWNGAKGTPIPCMNTY